MLESRCIGLSNLLVVLDLPLKMGITLAFFRIIREHTIQKRSIFLILVGTEVTCIICFITLVSMLLGPVHLLVLRLKVLLTICLVIIIGNDDECFISWI